MPLGAFRAVMLGAGGSAGGAQFFVGSFAVPGSNGNYAVTGVGFTPKAVIMWTSGSTAASGTWSGTLRQGIGFFTASESYSVSGASKDGVATSDAGRRVSADAFNLIDTDGSTVIASATVTSMDADGFTLNWTRTLSPTICFLAIGGDDVEAKVVNWTSPTATGNKAVTGVGFQPDVVLHTSISTSASPPSSTTGQAAGLGVMDSAGNQWVNAIGADDAVSPSDTARYQVTNRCIAILNGLDPAGGVVEAASYVSMDADGFTVNFLSNFGAIHYISLCLSGVSAKAGSFNKTTDAAPASQAVMDVGFQPGALLAGSFGGTAQTGVVADSFWSLGATDGTNERSVAQADQDNVNPTRADSLFHNDKAVLVQAASGNPPTTTAAADLTSFDVSGFTLNWTTNDATGWQVVYLALA